MNEAKMLSVWGWAWLIWWRWWSARRPAHESGAAANVSGRKVMWWWWWWGRSLRRPGEHQYKASALLLRGLLIFSMFFRIMSCNVTFTGGKKPKKIDDKPSRQLWQTTTVSTQTYVLISELGDDDLQTDVFLLVNLRHRAPVVLLVKNLKLDVIAHEQMKENPSNLWSAAGSCVNTHHMWVFGYFGNQLCSCDIISTKETDFKCKCAEIKAETIRVVKRDVCWPGYLVEVRSRLPFDRPEFSYRLLLNGHAEVVAVLYPGDEQLHPHFDLQITVWMSRQDKRRNVEVMGRWRRLELKLTVLHFSISVLISGLTFSMRSTRFALLFIIPPGMTKTLVPATGNMDPGWLKFQRVSKPPPSTHNCTHPCLPHLHLPVFSFWHFAVEKVKYLTSSTRQHKCFKVNQLWFSLFLVHRVGVGPGWGLEPSD